MSSLTAPACFQRTTSGWSTRPAVSTGSESISPPAHRAASLAEHTDPDELATDWEAYLDGTYGVCLHEVTPEAIVGKPALVSSLCELLMLPRPHNPKWRRALREQVNELDTLEREFAPDYDRDGTQERPPTRDLLIKAARERYPEIFAEAPYGAPAVN